MNGLIQAQERAYTLSTKAGWDTYVGAPEILKFLQGSVSPPHAPRPTALIKLKRQSPLKLACSASWTGKPTVTYAFVNAKTDVVLQKGTRPTYVVGPSARNTSIECVISATNAGGTAIQTSKPT